MKITEFVSYDGRKIALYIWDEVKNAKAVVKIVHGMAEHSARYNDFARYLNTYGYIVVMNDLRGHGETAAKGSLGYEDGDMWGNNVNDQLALLQYCAQNYNLPLFVMGHSYGSFVTQAVIERHPDVKGFVVCGSDYIKGASYKLCGVIARYMCRHKGGRYPAQLIANLSFGVYEKKFGAANAWLNRDADSVKLYNNDPMCGFTCSANFYRTFMAGISHLYSRKSYSAINTDTPIFIIAGSDDPVGKYGKGVRKLDKFYRRKVGVKDVSLRLYDGARHEILNETCKSQVYDDVVNWLDAMLSK